MVWPLSNPGWMRWDSPGYGELVEPVYMHCGRLSESPIGRAIPSKTFPSFIFLVGIHQRNEPFPLLDRLDGRNDSMNTGDTIFRTVDAPWRLDCGLEQTMVLAFDPCWRAGAGD